MQERRPAHPPRKQEDSSEFLDWVKKGALGGVVVVLAMATFGPMIRQQAPAPQEHAVQQPRDLPGAPAAPGESAPAAPNLPAPAIPGLRLADFRGEEPTAEARLVANWAVATRDHQQRAMVVIDKKDARVYVFGADGRLKDSAPALLGSARGDDSYPGIGDKPLKLIQPHEKTTPAGRFVAEPGHNASKEDIIWVDYDAAVSMHRIRPTVARERRLERLASLTVDDNRISFGCVNLPVSFYEDVLRPTVLKHGAIIYVLPEVKTPQEVFGAYDVTDPLLVAAHQGERKARAKLQKVALQAAR